MSIFGNFQDLSPAEAFTVAARSAGVLRLAIPELGEFAFEVALGRITGVTWQTRSVTDLFELQGLAGDLLSRRSGTFEFQRRPAGGSPHPLVDVPVAQFVANGLARAASLRSVAGVVPSVKTVFLLLRDPAVWLGDELQVFYERARSELLVGASAEQLAHSLHVTTTDAAWHLHRLRLAGVVQPRRQEDAAPPASLSAPTQPRRTRRFDPASIRAVRVAPPRLRSAGEGAASEIIDLRDVRTARPERSLLQRLTFGLRRMLGGSRE